MVGFSFALNYLFSALCHLETAFLLANQNGEIPFNALKICYFEPVLRSLTHKLRHVKSKSPLFSRIQENIVQNTLFHTLSVIFLHFLTNKIILKWMVINPNSA